MKMGTISRQKTIQLLILSFFLMFAFPSTAQAYIGPGAGFALIGSFFVMFTTLLSIILGIFIWPVRYLFRTIRSRKTLKNSRVKKFVILGLDGMDHGLTGRMLSEGKLPNLTKLREAGCFRPLATTIPSISPVAWSSFQTGVNPGKHNIFDFLTRNLKTYQPCLSSVDIRPSRKVMRFGKYKLPLGKPDIRLLRKSKTFWRILGEHGFFANVIRVPITFPPEKFKGVLLSGMCVPDLRGSQGTFSYYTTADVSAEHTGGVCYKVESNNNHINAELIGPTNPFRIDNTVLTAPFKVNMENESATKLKINDNTYTLWPGQYSDWIQVSFRTGLGIKIKGICKFLLVSTKPEFKLYVTPINIDPEKSAMPISYPGIYSTYLAKRQGSFATLGLAEDTWALNEGILSDESFIEQCEQMDIEREKMFFDALDKVKQGLVVCVFDGTDRIQHTFWRQIDDRHLAAHQPATDSNVIEELYIRADALVGKTVAKCDASNTVVMVISDHGFNSFRRGVDLNRWLETNGYLKRKDNTNKDQKYLSAVDFSQTKAFAVGLAGIYLNLKGRESMGIVEPSEEAKQLRKEISEKLSELKDSRTNEKAINNVYNSLKVYNGPYKGQAPDLIVGFCKGYRASWETAVGQITDEVFHDNLKPWSGDHCIDPELVPGVLFCNRKIADEKPRLMDVGPTVLNIFGVKVPAYMDGKALTVSDV